MTIPNVKVLRYNTTPRHEIQGFADIEIDGRWRLNGVNLMRDGSIRPGQLTPLINNRRCYIPSIEVLDPDLRESLTAEILAAIKAHLETLPPEQRMKPPRSPEPQKPAEPPGAVAASEKPARGKTPVQAKPAPAVLPAAQEKPKPAQPGNSRSAAEKRQMLPPLKLLANFPRRTL